MRYAGSKVRQNAPVSWTWLRRPTPHLQARHVVALLLAMLVLPAPTLGSAAQEATPDPAVPLVVVTFASADGSTFRAELEQPADIAAVQAALAGDGNAGIPNGALAYGDGGVNAPHEWHMEGTTLADVTIELCDGTATMVDEDIAYWVETVGQFCPWTATVVAVEPVMPPDNGEPPDDGPDDGGVGDGTSELPNTGAGTTAVVGASSTSLMLLIASGLAAGLLALAFAQRRNAG